MYKWFILLFLILLALYVLGTSKESFTQQDLNVNISPDNQTITIPGNLKTMNDQELKFLGNVNIVGRTTMDELISNNTTLKGTTNVDSVRVGPCTLKMGGDTLMIDKPVNFQGNVNVTGNINVNGNVCIQNGGNRWYIVVRGGNLHFVKNDPNNANADNHRNNEPHVIISADGNIWTSRQSFSGWIADSLNYIHSIRI
jgi:hypothetical protein